MYIAPNLWAQETDVYYNLRKHWGTVQAWLSALLAWRGIDETLAEEMAILPGMEEFSSLLWLIRTTSPKSTTLSSSIARRLRKR